MSSKLKQSGGTKFLKTVPDWPAIISGIPDFEETIHQRGRDVETGYLRLQRFVEKNGPRDVEATKRLRDGVLEIASEFQLSSSAAARLFIKLADLEGCYRINKEWDAAPKKTVTANRFDRIEKSISRISNFPQSDEMGEDEAIRFLIREGTRWAQHQDPDHLHELGFIPFRGKTANHKFEAVDYGASEIIRKWFQIAPLIHDFVKAAQARLHRPERVFKRVFKQKDDYGKPQLMGRHLAALYERTTGEKFGVSRLNPTNAEPYVDNVRGVRFVCMTMMAMGLDEPSPETVATYWRQWGKPIRDGRA